MARDIYQEVTDTIVDMLETAGEWSRPWVNLGTDALAPRSIDGRPYRGANVLLLWASAQVNGYEHGVWGTYRAWYQDRAATPEEIADGTARQRKDGEWRTATRYVREGEKATIVTLWKPYKRKATADEVKSGSADKDGKRQSLLLRHYNVFNAEQVEGWTPPVAPFDAPDPIEHAQSFFDEIGADVEYMGGRAYYTPALDRIRVPKLDHFENAEHFYATLAHEHGHWTGHKDRLNRDFMNRFGSEAYAFEELVAELSAAFTGARLGIGTTVREDHASYIKSWLKTLRNDKKAVFTAASAAQKATDFLVNAAGENGKADDEVADAA